VPNLGSGGTAGAGATGAGGVGGTGGATGGTGGSDPVAGAGGSTGGATSGAGGTDPVAGAGGSVAGAPGTGGTAGAPAVTLGSIQVDAGDKARDHTIVTFPYPSGMGKNLVLKDMQGNQIPMQVNPVNGNAVFILPSLPAGQQIIYTIEESAAAPPEGLTAVVEPTAKGDQLFVKAGAKQVFRWVLNDDNFRGAAANNVRSGYIYPLYTPGGLNVADDYQSDHPHMHGVWSAWTSTTFRGHKVDFWNGYANQGIVDLKSMDGAWSGPVHAGLSANLDHIDWTTDPDVVVLTEKWLVTVYKTHDVAPYYVFDVDSVQQTATTDPLVLEQYTYGGFGFRGSEQWTTPANVQYLSSEGHNRTTGDGQSARWVAQFGNVDGKPGGYAALGHPSNFRAPQGLRIHPTNPYWAFVPVTALEGGKFNIDPGKPYASRFRLITFDGNADAAVLNRIYDDYATPPTVTVLP
jgi:hypothetical protein